MELVVGFESDADFDTCCNITLKQTAMEDNKDLTTVLNRLKCEDAKELRNILNMLTCIEGVSFYITRDVYTTTNIRNIVEDIKEDDWDCFEFVSSEDEDGITLDFSKEGKKQLKLHNIVKIAGVDDIGEVSDGYHTFNSLYRQRCVLFAALVKAYKDKAWKSRRHSDGELCFGGGWFIVGIETPEGQYTYHYEDKDWNLFECAEVETAPEWDGHTDEDVERLLTL